MSQNHIQPSFHAGEWAPNLNARVDLAKYHSAAALLRNFFVDYRGGASTRTGSKYVLQAWRSGFKVRLIPFQASFTITYILEFGEGYIRFYTNGSPVLDTALNITGATQANPAALSVVNTYTKGAVSDWVYITGVGGMTQLNNRYFSIPSGSGTTINLGDLNYQNINSTGYGAYTSGGTVQRVYTIGSPYLGTDLSLLKFAQNANTLVICHPNYPPYVLTLNSAANWTLAPITFGPTISTPGGTAISTTLAAGSVNYGYCVTAVDANGQESPRTATIALNSRQDIRSTAGTITIGWTTVTDAVSYNIYKASPSYTGATPSGVAFGYIGNATGILFNDTNLVAPDFSQTPPVPTNPFAGAGVKTVTMTHGGTYNAVPNVVFSAPGGGGLTATGQSVMALTAVTVVNGGFGFPASYNVGDFLTLPNGIILKVTTVAFNRIVTINIISNGSSTTTIPTNPVSQVSTTGVGLGATFNLDWAVTSVSIVSPGTGYGGAPTVTFGPSGDTATATATIGSGSAGNPSVPTFFQQRLVLAAPPGAVQTFYMSQPGSYYNYNVSYPTLPDDAITGSLVANQLQTIKSMIAMPSGLILLSDRTFWQVNGGSVGSAVSAIDIVANPQSYVGASDVPPIVANFDILYVQSKGSIVRDTTYNFYANVYTGTDISILSSHLFFGYQITEWAWAEEPYKIVWAVRNDGILLSLTFLKEQELIGWAHHDTLGTYQSVATVTESVSGNTVDAIYTVVSRTINGFTNQYIERMADRYITNYINPWCVDCGLQYSGSATATLSGLEHLIGQTVTGLVNGIPLTPTVVSATGTVAVPAGTTFATVGLAFLPQLQTLALELGEPTVQGKFKKIVNITARVAQTLGLSTGTDFDNLVNMKDLILGNVGQNTNEIVSDLVTADATTLPNPAYTEQGQYCFQQSLPYPATILGVIPEFAIGDTK